MEKYCDPMKQDVLTELYAGVFAKSLKVSLLFEESNLENKELVIDSLLKIGNKANHCKRAIYQNGYANYDNDILHIKELEQEINKIKEQYL